MQTVENYRADPVFIIFPNCVADKNCRPHCKCNNYNRNHVHNLRACRKGRDYFCAVELVCDKQDFLEYFLQ